MKHITKLVVAFAIATLLLVGPAAAHVRVASTTLKLAASPLMPTPLTTREPSKPQA